MNPDAIDKDHAANRDRLTALSRRVLRGGLAVAGVGLVTMIGGMLALTFVSGEAFGLVATLYILGMWAFGGGLFVAFAGAVLRLFASWGSVVRYQVAETLPVVTDAARAVRDDLQR